MLCGSFVDVMVITEGLVVEMSDFKMSSSTSALQSFSKWKFLNYRVGIQVLSCMEKIVLILLTSLML